MKLLESAKVQHLWNYESSYMQYVNMRLPVQKNARQFCAKRWTKAFSCSKERWPKIFTRRTIRSVDSSKTLVADTSYIITVIIIITSNNYQLWKIRVIVYLGRVWRACKDFSTWRSNSYISSLNQFTFVDKQCGISIGNT